MYALYKVLLTNLKSSDKLENTNLRFSKYKLFKEYVNNLSAKEKSSSYYIVGFKFDDIPSDHCMLAVVQYDPLVCICYDSANIPGNVWIGTMWNYAQGLGWTKI